MPCIGTWTGGVLEIGELEEVGELEVLTELLGWLVVWSSWPVYKVLGISNVQTIC